MKKVGTDNLDQVLEDYLTFNELIIMSQMMIDLVNYESAKQNRTNPESIPKRSQPLSLTTVDKDLQANLRFCRDLSSKISEYLKILTKQSQ